MTIDSPTHDARADEGAYGARWVWWAAVAFPALLLAAALLFPARGDEGPIYAPVIDASMRAWPRVNTWNVQYGVSPIYLWLAGGLGALLRVPPHLAGRLVSVAAWSSAMFACFSRRRLVHPLALLALLNPIVLVFATRAHPYTLGLALAWAGWLRGRTSVVAAIVLAFASANVHNFMLPVVGFGALLQLSRSKRGLLVPGAIVAAAVLGVAASWLLYGGVFPKGFHSSPFYQSYGTFAGFNPDYIPLIAGFAGLLFLCLGEGPLSVRGAVVCAVLGVGVSLATLTRHAPIGPLFNAAAHGRAAGQLVASVVVGVLAVGFARAQDRRRETLLAFTALVLQLGMLPYLYERYVWFGIVPIVMAWSTLQAPARPRRIHGVYAVGALVFALAYLRFGSL